MTPSKHVIESLQRSTLRVSEIMLDLALTPGEAYSQNNGAKNQGVVALVGLAGDWSGTGCLSCTPEFACTLASHFLSQRFDTVTDDVLDSFGEIANIVIGNFKDDMEPHFGRLCLSIPTVVFGKNFTARSAGSADWWVIPFSSGNEVLEVKVCLAASTSREHRHFGGSLSLQSQR